MAGLTTLLAAGSLALGAAGTVQQTMAAKKAEKKQEKALEGQTAAAEAAAKLEAAKTGGAAKVALGSESAPVKRKKGKTAAPLGGISASSLGGL